MLSYLYKIVLSEPLKTLELIVKDVYRFSRHF